MVDDVPARRVLGPGRPYPLGCRPAGDGVDVAVLAPDAGLVELCLLERDEQAPSGWREERVPLPGRTHGVHHGHVGGVRAGQRYVLRAHGPWDPAHGHRHNPAKALLDPYARVLEGTVRHGPEILDHVLVDGRPGEVRSTTDSLGSVPVGVVVDEPEPVTHVRPRAPWSRSVVLETHVRGLTMRLPGVPPELRGTYAGLAHPVVLEHLHRLGVTAVELLPVHAGAPEAHLAARGLVNYWGYNTLSFFAPEPRYSAAVRAGADATAVLAEVRDMVATLHGAGVEVLLDVVYNHTCEGGSGGPTLSWRGWATRRTTAPTARGTGT